MAEVLPSLVNSWGNNVVGGLAGKLDHVFAEVGLYSLDTHLFKLVIEVYLLGGHGLALDHGADTLLLSEGDDIVGGLLGGARPDHLATGLLDGVGKHGQVVVQSFDGVSLDFPCAVSEFLPFGEIGRGVVALAEQVSGGALGGLLDSHVLNGASGACVEVFGRDLHVICSIEEAERYCFEARISAMCRAWTGIFWRLSPPAICMRHPASLATRVSAPDLRMQSSLRWRMEPDM